MCEDDVKSVLVPAAKKGLKANPKMILVHHQDISRQQAIGIQNVGGLSLLGLLGNFLEDLDQENKEIVSFMARGRGTL